MSGPTVTTEVLRPPASGAVLDVVLSRATLGQRMWRHRSFYLFISPFFLLFAIFGLYPLLFSLYLAFVSWDALTPAVWVGLENFKALFQDGLFFMSVWNTLVLGLLYVPPMFILAFVFALILNQQWLKMRAAWRAAVFIPVITPG